MQQNSNQNGISAALLSAINNSNKHQSHGLTVSEMEALKNAQANQEDIPTIIGNTKIGKEKGYKLPIYEKHMFHVYLETRQFDDKTGKKKSKGMIQKFYQNDFLSMSQTVARKGEKKRPRNAFSQYDVIDILHDPTIGNKNSESEDSKKTKYDGMTIPDLRAEYLKLTGNSISEEFEYSIEQLIFFIEDAISSKGQ